MERFKLSESQVHGILDEPVSRRDFLRRSLTLGAGAVAVGNLLVACADDDAEPADSGASETSPTPDEEDSDESDAAEEGPDEPEETEEVDEAEASRGGILRVPIPGNPVPNPITGAGGTSSILVNGTLFGGLVRSGAENLEPTPDLAESWETLEDGSVWVFNLRDGVNWHDGERFTAEDVAFTFNTSLLPETNWRFRVNFPGLQEVRVADELTAEFVFDQPYAPLLNMLVYRSLIMPKHLLEDQDINEPTDFVSQPVGNGPFKVDEAVAGDHWLVVANEEYWDRPPYLEGILFKVVPDQSAQIAQLRTGELDLVYGLPPAHAETIEEISGVRLDLADIVQWNFMSLNRGQVEAFDDIRVRQALTIGIDREAIVTEVVRGYGTVASGPIPPAVTPYFDPSIEPLPYDPDRAIALLEEAGWIDEDDDGIREKDGEPLSFECWFIAGHIESETNATLLQQFYRDLGVDMRLNGVEFSVFFDAQIAGTLPSEIVWQVIAADPSATADWFSARGLPTASDRLLEGVEELYDELSVTMDVDARIALAAQLQETLRDQAPHVFLYYPKDIRGISETVGFFPATNNRDAFANSQMIWKQE